MNGLMKEDKEKLWLPLVIYENTDHKYTTRLAHAWEYTTRVLVERQGKFTLSGLDSIDEIEIFKGSENNIIMSQTYTREFQCNYKFLHSSPHQSSYVISVRSIFINKSI